MRNLHEIFRIPTTENFKIMTCPIIFIFGIMIIFLLKQPGKPFYIKLKYKYLPKYLVLITTCDSDHKVRESLTKNKINSLELECNQETRFDDCIQNIRLLEFFVDHYQDDLAKTYVITDEHIEHWHHGNITECLLDIENKKIFDDYEYNGYFDYWNDENFTKKSSWDLQSPPYSFYDLMSYFFDDMGIDWEGYNSYPSCTTFFMKAEMIRTHSIDFYRKLITKGRDWSRKHKEWKPYPGYYCGRVFEYSYHLIFGKNKLIDKPPFLCNVIKFF